MDLFLFFFKRVSIKTLRSTFSKMDLVMPLWSCTTENLGSLCIELSVNTVTGVELRNAAMCIMSIYKSKHLFCSAKSFDVNAETLCGFRVLGVIPNMNAWQIAKGYTVCVVSSVLILYFVYVMVLVQILCHSIYILMVFSIIHDISHFTVC